MSVMDSITERYEAQIAALKEELSNHAEARKHTVSVVMTLRAELEAWREIHETDLAENVKICAVIDKLRVKLKVIEEERDGLKVEHENRCEAASKCIKALTAERDRLKAELLRRDCDTCSYKVSYPLALEEIKKLDSQIVELKAELKAERGKTADACLKNGELAHELAKRLKEVAVMEGLLAEWMPVMRAHTGASHLTDGFRPTPNKWDDLMGRTG